MNVTSIRIFSIFQRQDDTSVRMRDYTAGVLIIILTTLIFCFPIFEGRSFNIVGAHMFVQYPWIGITPQSPEVTGTGSYQTDAAETYYPYFGFLTETIRHGDLPLWMPGVFGGQPLEIILGGIYYPPRFLLIPFFNTARQIDILLISHLLMAGIGMFFFLYIWKAGFLGAVFGAVVWEFSGHQATWLLFPSPIAAAAWLPLTLIGATLAVRNRSWFWAIICGVALGMVINAGDLHFPYVNGLLLAGWYFLLLIPEHKPQNWNALRHLITRWLVYPLISAISTLLISLPSWLPLFLAFPYIHRAPYSLDAQLAGLAYVFPSRLELVRAFVYFRDYAKNVGLPSSIFIGLPALLATPLAILRKSRLVIFFLVAGLFSFLILLGFRPFNQMLQNLLPLYAVFHLHRAWTYLLVLSLTVLAAFGFDGLFHTLGKRLGNPSLSKWMGMIVLLLEAFVLISAMRSITPLQPERAEWLYPTTPLIRKLQSTIGQYRMLPVYDLQKTWTAPMFAGNSSILFGLRSGGGYQSLLPYESVFLWKTVQLGGTPATLEDLPPNSYRPYYFHNRIPLELLEKLSIGYLVTPPHVKPLDPNGTDLKAMGKINLIYEGPDGWIYSVNRALPRAFLVTQVEVILEPQAALQRLADPSFDAHTSAIISSPLPQTELDLLSPISNLTQASVAQVRIISEDTDQIMIQTESANSGVLVVNDTWWSGWHVYVDGVERSILKVNFGFRGVFVPAGSHKVEFIYRPLPLLISLIISSFCLGLTIFLIFIVMVRSFQKKYSLYRIDSIPSSGNV